MVRKKGGIQFREILLGFIGIIQICVIVVKVSFGSSSDYSFFGFKRYGQMNSRYFLKMYFFREELNCSKGKIWGKGIYIVNELNI